MTPGQVVVEPSCFVIGEFTIEICRDEFAHGVTCHINPGRTAKAFGSRGAKLGVVDDLTELAIAAAEGNRVALDRFAASTIDDVRALCWHLGDPDSVDDLVQETYARAVRSLPRFRGDGPARSWLMRIARNTCADATRRRRRQRTRRSYAEIPDIGDAGLASWVEVDDLVAGLDTDRRHAFVLTQLMGLSYQETAEILGCPLGTVRSRVARARSDLLSATEAERVVVVE